MQHELPFEEFIGLVNEGCILIVRGILKLIINNYCMYIIRPFKILTWDTVSFTNALYS